MLSVQLVSKQLSGILGDSVCGSVCETPVLTELESCRSSFEISNSTHGSMDRNGAASDVVDTLSVGRNSVASNGVDLCAQVTEISQLVTDGGSAINSLVNQCIEEAEKEVNEEIN